MKLVKKHKRNINPFRIQKNKGNGREKIVKGQATPRLTAKSQRHIRLIKTFIKQANTLPKFKAGKKNTWDSFENTLHVKWANSTISKFPIVMHT